VEGRSAEEGQNGVYREPVAMGMTVIREEKSEADGRLDPENLTMPESLQLAWRIARGELRKRIDPRNPTTLAVRLTPRLVRLAPRLRFESLSGRSASGLLCCAMYAAATETSLNTDWSGSFCIQLADTAAEGAEDLEPHDIVVTPVGEESIPYKLRAASEHVPRVRHVLLHRQQAQGSIEKTADGRSEDTSVRSLAASLGIEVHGVSTLAEAFPLLTGDAAIDRVLADYCREQIGEWAKRRRDPNDPDKLRHFVKFHYSKRARGRPSDTSSRAVHGAGKRQEVPDPYCSVAEASDSWRSELIKLLELSHRLCVTEDAGAGKSIFTRFLAAFLSSENAQKILCSGKPCLVARFERGRDAWPMTAEEYEQKLAERILPVVRATNPDLAPEKVIDWALENQRVVLIMDALDQVSEQQTTALAEFLSNRGGGCRVVLTSRSFAVDFQGCPLFGLPEWRYARIDGFDREQQEKYLSGCYVRGLEELFPNYGEVAELLRVPAILSFVRELVDDDGPPAVQEPRA
jgi:hypothetical protein